MAHNRGEWFQRLRMELRRGVRGPRWPPDLRLPSVRRGVPALRADAVPGGPRACRLALRETAERSGVLRAVAFATALRGETALLMGDLAAADTELQDAVDLHRDIGSAAGEAHSLQRLAEVKLAAGEREEANRLLHRALPLARFSSVALHLIQRVYGTMIAAAPDAAAARAMVEHGRGCASGSATSARSATIMLAVPAALACADVGDIDDARRASAGGREIGADVGGNRLAGVDTRGPGASGRGERRSGRRERLLRGAAELFEPSGQPLDARRCRVAPIATE